MRDTLKDFVENNRESFDDLLPGDLWSSINTSLHHSSSPQLTHEGGLRATFLKNLPAMLKYGFGASALILGTFLLVNSQKEKTSTSRPESRLNTDSPAASFKVPKFTAGATLLTKNESEVPGNGKADAVSEKNQQPSRGEQTPEDNTQEDTLKKEEISVTVKAIPPYFVVKVPKDDSLSDKSYTSVDTLFRGIKKIQVSVDFCDVSVCAVQGDKVSLHGKVSESAGSYIVLGRRAYKKSEYRLKFETKDSVLKVWMESEKTNKKMLSRDMGSETSVLNFEVPASIDVDINNSSGDIAISGLSNKSTRLMTSFGDIKANNISSHLTVHSSSGNTMLTKITGEVRSDNSFGHQVLEEIKGNVNVRTSSGNSTIKSLKGNATINTAFGHQTWENINGNILSIVSSGDLTVKYLTGNIDAKSSFGNQTYDNIVGDVTAKASSGSIKMNGLKGMLVLGTNFGNIIGKNVTLVNKGDFKTSSGNIQMNLLNEMNDLSFDLQSNSGQLSVEKANVKNTSNQKLVMGQGNIVVKGISSFGNQTYK